MSNSQKNVAGNLLALQTYKGDLIGFFSGSARQECDYLVVKGWWERKSGAEGGELYISIDKYGMEIYDFDGCGELPSYIQEELGSLGVKDELI